MTTETIEAPAADQRHPKPETAHYLQLEDIRPGPYQPRKRFNQEYLEKLAGLIARQGVLQAIVVRKVTPAKPGGATHEIVAGERRWRACKILVERGFPRPHVIPAFVRDLDDFQAAEVALVENDGREDLHPLEQAQAYENLLLKQVGGGEFKPPRLKGYTVEQLAEKIGHEPNFVFGRLKLLKLIPAAKDAFLEDKLKLKIAEAIARYPAAEQERAVPVLLEGWGGEPYSHRQAMAYLRDHFMLKLSKAVFAIADASLVPKAGACTDCPKRSGNNPGLFGDGTADDMCLDSDCHEGKVKAHIARQLETARAAGKEVLVGKAAEKVVGKHGTATSDYTLQAHGHLNLDKPAPQLTGSRKTLRKLLGDDFDKSILVKGDHDELPATVAKQADVKAALKAKGLLPPSVKNGKVLSAEDIEKQRSERIDKLIGERVHTELAKHFAKDSAYGFPGESAVWLRWLARSLYDGDADVDALRLAMTGSKADGSLGWIDKLDAEGLARVVMALVIGEELKREHFPHWNSTEPADANALAKDIGFDLPALREEISEEVDSAIRDEIQALADVVAPAAKKTAGAKKVAGGKASVKYRDPMTGATWSGRGLQPTWLRVALAAGKSLADFDVSTPRSSAAAQGNQSPAETKKDELTPEKALADAVAKEAGVDLAKLTAKPAKRLDDLRKFEESEHAMDSVKATAKSSTPKTNQKDEPAQPPAGAERAPKVGARWKVRADVKGRAKTAGREGAVDSVRGSSVTLRWGPKAHEVGVYDVKDLEFVKHDPDTIGRMAWPFPTSASMASEAKP